MKRTATLFSALACLALPAAAADLPGSDNPIFAWDILTSVTFEEVGDDENWRVEKTFPQGYENSVDAFVISGWAVIYEAQGIVTEVLLVPQAEDCPFCSGGGDSYGPTLEVIFDRPVGITVPEDRITVKGRLTPIRDDNTLQAFRLVEARLIAGGGS